MKECNLKIELHVKAIKRPPRDYIFIDNRIFLLHSLCADSIDKSTKLFRMAPSYDNLPSDDELEEDEIDFTDLQQQYEVRLEEGLDTFVVIEGLPVVPEESRQKLIKFLLRKLNTIGKAKEDGVFMPLNDEGMTEGYGI